MRKLKKAVKGLSEETIRKRLFVFDVETTKLEPMAKNFVFGVLYGWNFKKVFYKVSDFKKEFAKKKYDKCFVFAHNAEFDLTTVYGNIYKNLDNSAIFNGKFISAKLNGLTFGDSLNIYPTKLENIGKLFGLKKLENSKVKNNKLTKNNITDDDINYCVRDCEIVYKALTEIFLNVGVIKLTISSLAMYDYRKNYLTDDVVFSELTDEFYSSYYGGRTEAFRIGKVNSYVYDKNSLYPYSMLNCVFPDIRNLKKETLMDLKYFNFLLSQYEGLAKVDIEHKETYFGFLPYKWTNEKKETKLIFPVGNFTTTVNFNELRFAIKKGVVKVVKVHYAVYGNPTESPFKNFVTTNYNNRMNSNDELEKLILKLKLNSLYGKFAQRLKFKQVYYDMIPFEIIDELEKTEKFYELKMFSSKRNDCFLVTNNENFKNSFFAIPTYSSYITSFARVEILKALIENENNNVSYCDTDSVFLDKNFIGRVGKELGYFKKEKKKVVEVKGLKHYIYYDIDLAYQPNRQIYLFGNFLKTKETLKGVSKNSIKIADNIYKKTQYFKTLESLRRNKEAGEKKEVVKIISGKYDKRIILENGNTKPIKLNSYEV